jgi:hypothetical protein
LKRKNRCGDLLPLAVLQTTSSPERETERGGSLCGSHVVLAVVSKEKDGRKEGNG